MRQLFGKTRIQQIRVARPAAVMHETDNRTDSQFAQATQTLVGPMPIDSIQSVRRKPLPQNWIANRLDSKRSEAFQIARAPIVAAAIQLIEISVAHAIMRAFDTAPDFKRLRLQLRLQLRWMRGMGCEKLMIQAQPPSVAAG